MTDPTIVHTEHVTDAHGDFTQIWHLTPPPVGTRFIVYHETWNNTTTPPERHIYRYSLTEELAR